MIVTNPKELILNAWHLHYALPAFNVCNIEMARAVLEAAETEQAPVILQAYPGDIRHAGLSTLSCVLKVLAARASIPVFLHLDHPDDLSMTLECLRHGFGSVMFDGGHLPIEQNILETRRVVEIAHDAGAIVEGELGQFGGEHQGMRVEATHPSEAGRMFEEAEVDMLAVSVGSIHGEKSRLDLNLLEQIVQHASGPLVLHGGSGIYADDLREAVKLGVVKINIGAAIIDAWLTGLKQGMQLEISHYPKHYHVMRHAVDSIRSVAQEKLKLAGASGKAANFEEVHTGEPEKT